MNDSRVDTIQNIAEFLNNTDGFVFKALCKREAYAWIEQTLIKFRYYRQDKPEKSLVQAYLKKVTGYSRSQIKRLIARQQKTGRVKLKSYQRHHFATKYINAEIILLAKTDALHDFPNGQALKRILQRMDQVYGDSAFTNLSQISAQHIYNLRRSLIYKKLNKRYEKTKPVVINIGKREKPEPNGRPGYLRVDTVHQGDQDGTKGVYHINVIDEVTQFQFVAAVEKISEDYLLPILKQLLEQFPFIIRQFHSDNGSEYINHTIARLLNKLLIKLTKSRPRKTTDNALVESKNGSIIRKWMGYCFIPQRHATTINEFYFGIFNEYLNYHRPCAFASIRIDKRGKEKRVYKQEDYQTPHEKLTSIPKVKAYLKPAVTIQQLDQIAKRYTDNEIAQLVQQERSQAFSKIFQS
jgi:transposase InsO family protein